MKAKILKCLGLIAIIVAMPFVAFACTGGNDNKNNNFNQPAGNQTTPPTAPAQYTVEVVGGLGSGVYKEGANVTITSNDDFFLWWQVEGENVKLSTKKTYTFVATRNVKIVSYGSDRYAGFAVLESQSLLNNWIGNNSVHNFEGGLHNSYVDGREVNALYLRNDCWYSTGSNFKHLDEIGNSIYKVSSKNGYIYVHDLYKDIDGKLKALSKTPIKIFVGMEMTVATGDGSQGVTFVWD